MSIGDRDRIGSSYQVGEMIGRGASGVVYRAFDPVTEAALAIKVLHPHLIGDTRATGRFIQERHVLSRISHPNVVRVLELIADGGQLSIVMELVEGGDLKALIQQARLTSPEAVRIATALADGLTAMHNAGVVHRDLKPANVLMDIGRGQPSPKITDFGLSRLVEEGMSQSSAAVGTPLYMAPEAVERASEAGPPADVYALGVMLFELLVGEPPFRSGGTMAILRAHSVEPPPAIEGVPPTLGALVQEMLAKDPAARPSAAQVRDRLARLAGQVGPSDVARALPAEGVSLLESETVTRVRPLLAPALPGSGSGSGSGGGPAVTGAGPGLAVSARGFSVAEALRQRPGLVALVAAAAVVVVAAGLGSFLLLSGGDEVPAVPLEHAFNPESLPGGGIVSRSWTMSPDGALLQAEVIVHNAEGEPLSVDYVEVLPASLGVELAAVRFEPQPAELLADDLAARVEIDDLAPTSQHRFTYEVDLPPGEATADRLARLAGDQVEAQRQWYDENNETAPTMLELGSLTISPRPVNLEMGRSQDLVVTGKLADGTPAPEAALGAVAWSSDDPTVAVVAGRRVVSVGPGTAAVTAQVGDVTASTDVVVTGREIALGPERTLKGQVMDSVTGTGTGSGSGTGSETETDSGPETGTDTSTGPDPTGPQLSRPNPPPSVTASLTATPSELRVNWNGGTENGSPVTEYEVRPVGQASRSAAGSARSLTFTGLSYDTGYRFEVRARNSVGWSDWSTASPSLNTPEAPGRPAAAGPAASNVTATGARVTFNSSTCTTAYYRTNDPKVYWESPGWPAARHEGVNCWFAHGHTFSGLKPGTTYTVTVELRDTAGESYDAPPVTFTTLDDPVALTLDVGSSASYFELTVNASSNSCVAVVMSGAGAPPTTTTAPPGTTPNCALNHSRTFTNLDPGGAYTVTVVATDGQGRNATRTVLATTRTLGDKPKDLNGDGQVSCADAELLLAKRSNYDPGYDYDADRQLTILDALILLQTRTVADETCPATG